jgi:hypothetical protein
MIAVAHDLRDQLRGRHYPISSSAHSNSSGSSQLRYSCTRRRHAGWGSSSSSARAPSIATPIAGLAFAHVTVQPVSGGFLVAGARCRRRRGGRNGVLYDCDGQVVCEGVLGDGIGHIQATRDGRVWIGCFDEGISGNYGWGQAGADEPVGAAGIIRFSPGLEPAWHYPRYTEADPWDAISDCYALNVDDQCAWACYACGFPVVRIGDGTVTGWQNEINGGRALAVAGSRVVLFGGYGPGHDRLVLTELCAGRAQPAGQDRVVLPGGEHHPAGTPVTGRGSRLHFLSGTSWHQLDTDDIPA